MKYGIIGGTGVYGLDQEKEKNISNQYGEVNYSILDLGKDEIIFITRHGKDHTIPPHKINYRANLQAMYDLGVRHIIGTAAVGSCHEDFPPGQLVLVEDFLDFTKNRQATFFDGLHNPVKHVEMSHPYCPNMNNRILEKAAEDNINLLPGGIYVTAEGPRFETPAEIRFYQMIGGNLVGMTNSTEATLAKELGLCYSCIAFVVNWCTGVGGVIEPDHLQKAMGDNKEIITKLAIDLFQGGLDQESCRCKNSFV